MSNPIIASITVEPEGISVPQTATVVATVGIQGPAGASTSGYTHTQTTPAAVWTVNHNLGFKPVVEVRNVLAQVVLAEVEHLSDNQTRITFGSAQTGSVRFG